MVLLIVDGPDRVGKTTLIREIIRQRRPTSRFLLFSNLAPPKSLRGAEARDWNLGIYRMQVEIAKTYNIDVICDRLLLSELVYGHIYRGMPTSLKMPHFAGAMPEPALQVVVTASPDTILKRDDGDSTFKNDGRTALVREVELFERLGRETEWIKTIHVQQDEPYDYIENAVHVCKQIGWL